jgi:hypothetical protein
LGRWGAIALVWTLAGCQPATAPNEVPKSDPAAGGTATADGNALFDVWDAYYLKGAKIGYGHTVSREIDRAGKALVETTSLNHLRVERFGQTIEQELKLSTVETPDGQVREFRTEAQFGPAPTIASGVVVGNSMLITTDTGGARQEVRLRWSAEIRGFLGVEQSLAGKPLAPGEKRALRMLAPLLNQVADVELAAGDYETTKVLDAEQELLRIESVARLPDGNVMAESLWTDRAGQVIKRRIEGIGQESFRTNEALAKEHGRGGPTVDLGSDTLVKLDRPLENALATREARYRVTLASGDPSRVFATGLTQSVRRLGPREAEVTVHSIRPGEISPAGDPADAANPPVDEKYATANSVLQTNDARIQAMAKRARGSETDPVKVALALERYVHENMASSDFSQAFATAAEVAESRRGDCTEHAVLLAALARACGIPSRVAIGLVYVPRVRGFGYHMWTEVYLHGRWVPLDATLGQGGIGGAHLKLVDSSLDGATAYSAFLPVAQVVGQLKIEVVEAK